jgi:putative SOS response-associated peptidase YedK
VGTLETAVEILHTCTILTTKPNSLVADVHDRMPLILRKEDYDLSLDADLAEAVHVCDKLNPFDSDLMKRYPVSSRVNRPENNDSACAREVPMAMATQTLF